jgi:hypothetical protein
VTAGHLLLWWPPWKIQGAGRRSGDWGLLKNPKKILWQIGRIDYSGFPIGFNGKRLQRLITRTNPQNHEQHIA